jgi:hypothetical protein
MFKFILHPFGRADNESSDEEMPQNNEEEESEPETPPRRTTRSQVVSAERPKARRRIFEESEPDSDEELIPPPKRAKSGKKKKAPATKKKHAALVSPEAREKTKPNTFPYKRMKEPAIFEGPPSKMPRAPRDSDLKNAVTGKNRGPPLFTMAYVQGDEPALNAQAPLGIRLALKNIHFFVVTNDDIRAKNAGQKDKLEEGQIGIRCGYCAEHDKETRRNTGWSPAKPIKYGDTMIVKNLKNIELRSSELVKHWCEECQHVPDAHEIAYKEMGSHAKKFCFIHNLLIQAGFRNGINSNDKDCVYFQP